MPRKKIIRELKFENENMKVEFIDQVNKFDYEKKLAYITYKGVKCIPMYTFTFFTLDEESRVEKNNKYSQRNDRLRKNIECLLRNQDNEYTRTLEENIDYFIISKNENIDDWQVYTDGLNACYTENVGKSFKNGNASKVAYLFTLEGARLMLSNFKFARDYDGEDRDNKYSKQIRDRAIYFTRTEELIKKVFDVDINCHEWFYLNGNQLEKFQDLRIETIANILILNKQYYDEDDNYKYAFGMTKCEQSQRDKELQKIVEYHIDDTFGHGEKLSYKCINYTSYLAMKQLYKEIKEATINIKTEKYNKKQFILNLVKIYKPLKSIINYGGGRVYEQYLINKKYNMEDRNTYGVVGKSLFLKGQDEEFKSNTLRYKIKKFKNHSIEVLESNMRGIEEVDKEYLGKVYDNCYITIYLNKLKEYQGLLREYYSLKYDVYYNKDKNRNLIGFSYMKFLKNELKYGFNYTQQFDEYCKYEQGMEVVEEYESNIERYRKEVKSELLELRNKKIKLENTLIQMSVYLKEFLEEGAFINLRMKNKNDVADLGNLMDIDTDNWVSNIYMEDNGTMKTSNGSKVIKARHKNKLLEM